MLHGVKIGGFQKVLEVQIDLDNQGNKWDVPSLLLIRKKNQTHKCGRHE